MSPNQAMVKASVEQSVVIICSGYKLQDSTGQRFGRSNRTEFSQGYSLAVVTDSGIEIDLRPVHPRNADEPIEVIVLGRDMPDKAVVA